MTVIRISFPLVKKIFDLQIHAKFDPIVTVEHSNDIQRKIDWSFIKFAVEFAFWKQN